MGVDGFAFSRGDLSHENKAIRLYSINHDIPCTHFNRPEEVPSTWIPHGSLDWFRRITGWSIRPDYYPTFLSSCLGRHVWETNTWPFHDRVFIKPSDTHKRFNGRITIPNSWKGKKKGPYWCSDVVTFTDEWRYYITDGKVVAAKWYFGNTEDRLPPELPAIPFPSDWCGTVDFGETEDKRFLLIEAHEPFCCGWYGSINDTTYAEWVVSGYEYLRKIYGGK